jgi:predicted AlkP superfamily pyrophosphatase or phosphodiesterase
MLRMLSLLRIPVLLLQCVTLAPAILAQEKALANPTSPKYILFLTADGFRSDYLDWYAPPNLKQLCAQGVRVLRATNVFPTLTAPNMCSLVTGSYPRTTGIAANSQYVKERDEIALKNRDNKAETISETLHRAGWITAAVNQFMLENRGTDFYVSTDYDHSAATTAAILDALKGKKPQFVGAIYGATDHAGHRYGPRSDEVKKAVSEIDAAIGELIKGLKEQGIFGQTLIVFSADHGMSAYAAKQPSIDAAAALKKAGFRVATSQEQLQKDTQIVVIANGVRVVYFRDVTPEEKAKATQVLSTIEGAEVLDRKKLDELGCHNNRSGDLIVSPLPGYVLSGVGRTGGLHGQFTERNPILFFYGPGVKKGATIESAQNIDVVPTLLSAVGIAPASTVEGRVIQGVFETR